MSSIIASIAEIRDSLPPEKNRFDSLWIRFVLRPLSFSIAWLILGITWALLLFISGTWALQHLLSLNKESSSE